MSLRSSVGVGGENRPEDVRRLQRLLRANRVDVEVTGRWDRQTVDAWLAAGGTERSEQILATDELLQELLRTELDLDNLPEPTPKESGYYRYEGKARQWGTTDCIQALRDAAKSFRAATSIDCGVGDISLENGGPMPPHATHTDGTDVDVRPIRKDGKNEPVSIRDLQYDHGRTETLVKSLLDQGNVFSILFNDSKIVEKYEQVKEYEGHDNHLHVNMKR